jgi:hypothetical protein
MPVSKTRKKKTTAKNTQKKTNQVFRNNLDTFTGTEQKLGVMAIFDTGKSLVPFRFVLPYDNILVLPTDTEHEIISNVGMLFYGVNYYEEVKNLQNISHEGFIEALTLSLGAHGKFLYELNDDKPFENKSFGMIVTYNFKKNENFNYNISATTDVVYSDFEHWLNSSDRIKLHLSENYDKGEKVTENRVFVSSDEITEI